MFLAVWYTGQWSTFTVSQVKVREFYTVYQVCVFISVLGNNSYVLALVSESVILM